MESRGFRSYRTFKNTVNTTFSTIQDIIKSQRLHVQFPTRRDVCVCLISKIFLIYLGLPALVPTTMAMRLPRSFLMISFTFQTGFECYPICNYFVASGLLRCSLRNREQVLCSEPCGIHSQQVQQSVEHCGTLAPFRDFPTICQLVRLFPEILLHFVIKTLMAV